MRRGFALLLYAVATIWQNAQGASGRLHEASFRAWMAQPHESHTSPFSVMFVFEAGT